MTKLTQPAADMSIEQLKAAALIADVLVAKTRDEIKALGVDGETTWATIDRLGDDHPTVFEHVENVLDKMEIADRLQSMYGAKTWNEWVALLMVEPVPADEDTVSA
jgi:DNA-binding CsgD family transcriptional regulator